MTLGHIVILDDRIKATLDEMVTSEPSELARTVAAAGGVKGYLTKAFSENLKISKLENERDQKLKKLEEDIRLYGEEDLKMLIWDFINEKPRYDDLEKLANRGISNISVKRYGFSLIA